MRPSPLPPVLVLLTALMIAAPFSAAADCTFGPDIRVNDDPQGLYLHDTESSGQHSIAAKGDTIYFAWGDGRGDSAVVRFARSADGGEGFGPNVQVSDVAGGWFPSLAVGQNGAVYVAWRDCRDHEDGDIYFDMSVNGGVDFGKDVRVDDAGTTLVYERDPCVAVDQQTGYIYVAWLDSRDLPGVYFARSVDGGHSFGPNIRADDADPEPIVNSPAIAVGPSGDIDVAWYEDYYGAYREIRLAVSHDHGESFGSSVHVGYGGSPSVAVSPSGEVYVGFGYVSPGGYQDRVEVARSFDGGETFYPSVVAGLDAGIVSLAVRQPGHVFISWGPHSSHRDISFAYSADSGSVFSAPTRVNDTPGNFVWNPTLTALADGRVALAWTDYRAGILVPDVYFDIGVPATDVGWPRRPTPFPGLLGGLEVSPNPFARRTTLRCLLPTAAPSEGLIVSILSVQGKCVRELQPESSDAVAEAEWDGTDDSGRPLPSGIYLARLRVGDREFTERLVLVR